MIDKIRDNQFFEKIIKLQGPSIVYNFDFIKFTIDSIREDIIKHVKNKSNIKLYYSCKANTNPEVLAFLNPLVDGFDVASKYEFQKVKEFKNNISFTTPHIEEETLHELYFTDNIFDFNSISQLQKFAPQLKNREIGLRINANLEDSNKTIFGEKSRFGIDFNDLRLVDIINTYSLTIKKIHFHTGEKNISISRNVLSLVEEILDNEIYNQLEIIDIGGGLFNIYKKREDVETFWRMINDFSNAHPKLYLIIEPGNLLLAMSGYLIASVGDVSFNENNNRIANLTLNVSSHNIFTWNRPNLIFPKKSVENNPDAVLCNIYGATCYEMDFFVTDFLLDKKHLKIDSKFIFGPVGAYVKANAKNLHDYPFPKEYYFIEGNIHERLEMFSDSYSI